LTSPIGSTGQMVPQDRAHKCAVHQGRKKVLSQCGRRWEDRTAYLQGTRHANALPTFASVKTVWATSEEDAEEIMKERFPRATVFHVWRPEPGRRGGDS
jgi:hypothetical protein